MLSETNDITLTGIIAFIIMAGFRLMETLVKKITGNGSVLAHEERLWLSNLYEMHNQKDSNGVPLCFVPRDWLEGQKEILKSLQQVAIHQERTSMVLEKILDKLA